jgi:hypothetical protein
MGFLEPSHTPKLGEVMERKSCANSYQTNRYAIRHWVTTRRVNDGQGGQAQNFVSLQPLLALLKTS